MRTTFWLAIALVLAGLIVMTAARFVSTGVQWLVMVASFSSYALLGFLVVLVTCLVLLSGMPSRPWVLLAAGLAGLGLVVQGWSLVPLFAGGDEGKPDLTVMTSNLRFGQADTATVLRTVATQDVDVLVLQEVTPTALQSLRAAGLAKLLQHHRGVPVVTAAGTMVFSRYALTSPRSFKLGNVGLDVRVAADPPFRLLAVHTFEPVGHSKPWLVDMGRVRERAAAAVDDGPTLVVGDFNATHDHQPFRAVLDTGLRDAAEQAGSGWQSTWPTRYRKSWLRPLIAIDHVLSSHQYQAVSTRTVEVPRTDHLALVAKLRLVRQGAGQGPAGGPG